MIKKHGKKYRAALALLPKNRNYSLEEGVALAKKTSITKFDASLEIHLKLGLDLKKADQTIRSTVVLPHGTGKEIRVIAFVTDDKVKEAKEAGAIKAGGDDLIEEINKGWLDFEVAVALPEMMKKLGKIARILGQKGLMPNPKAGTITPEIKKTIQEIKKGKVEFRSDKLGNLHNVIGKVSFPDQKIVENIKAYLKAVLESKPKGGKGTYLESLTLSSTMGPGIPLEISQVKKEL